MRVTKTTERVRVEMLTAAEELAKDIEALQGLEPKEEAEKASLAQLVAKKTTLLEALKLKDEKRVVFLLAPLSHGQKAQVTSLVTMKAGKLMEDSLAMSVLAVKLAVKGVEGIEDADGQPYKLVFDKTGLMLDDATVSDLMNLDRASEVMITASMHLVNDGVPSVLRNRVTGQTLSNVEVIRDPKA